ncbi:RNA polymerase subunit, RPB6/omega [Moorella glycerini]|uniref:DNA-directed RNA polymerase subunit omega n=1 Tax=Neomoorella stamsii TaxID=1266720 RepID=A0A9X7P5S4_9FIRM|nr:MULTISPECIES: DNA-directed RNA polymerase subunit omega [Moorella]PRR72159.1 DNA-directed RNA polymerase subunit omega [Moorella stamsii]CEP69460.1 RNA polymerase subunit, RPB6/omega [Moorella glycerini]
MKQPSLDQLEKRVGSKYALAVLAAKRARTLTEGQFANLYPKGTKPVTVALMEIAEGKIKYEWGKKKA